MHGAQNIRMCKLLHSCHWYIYIYMLFFWKLFPSVTLKDGMAGEKEKDAESYSYM